MKIIKFLVCFLIAKSMTLELSELRAKSVLRVEDVYRVMEETSELEEFSKSMDANYEGHKFRMVQADRNILLYDFLYVNGIFKRLSHSFMTQSSMYIVQNLRKYCDLAIELITFKFEGITPKEKLETLRFAYEHRHCVLTAFTDLGLSRDLLEIDLLFESMFLFQTIDPDDDPTLLDDLELQIRWYKKRYDHLLISTGTEIFQLPTLDTSLAEYREALNAVEKRITDFTHKFCLSWRPFVKGDLLRAETQSAKYGVQKHSPFIQHTLQHEKCEIDIVQEDNVQIKNQQYGITTWYCDNILESQEYRYEAYKENKVTEQTSSSARSNPQFRSNPFTNVSEFSLTKLKEGLKFNSYYLNVVRYYNIMADVMLLVSIKEGDKILKGIKLVVLRNGEKETERVEEFRELRSVLSQFKSVFDDLVFLILNQRRIIDSVKNQMKSFDDRVNSVKRLLDIQNDPTTKEQTDRICSKITKTLADLRGDAHLGDDWTRFKEFYFTESILHIRELYSYSAINF